MNPKKGFADPVTIGIVAFVVVIVIMFGYYVMSKKDSAVSDVIQNESVKDTSSTEKTSQGESTNPTESTNTQLTSNNTNNNNTSMIENNKEITWKEFFPELGGNINEYKVTLPVNYVQHKGASFQSPKKTAYLWGTPEDVEMVKADPEITDFDFETFDIAKQGIFIARFIQSSNYQVTNGQITDNNGRPLDEKTYTWEEAKNVKIQKGALYGIPDSFAFAVTGRIPGDPVNFRQLLIHNPGDASILLIELTGGPDSVNDEIWNTFVASLNIK